MGGQVAVRGRLPARGLSSACNQDNQNNVLGMLVTAQPQWAGSGSRSNTQRSHAGGSPTLNLRLYLCCA